MDVSSKVKKSAKRQDSQKGRQKKDKEVKEKKERERKEKKVQRSEEKHRTRYVCLDICPHLANRSLELLEFESV